MWQMVQAGGALMLPILLCSALVLAIGINRYLALRPQKITPEHERLAMWQSIRQQQLDTDKLRQWRATSPMGAILVAGISSVDGAREVVKEQMQDAASAAIHDMERFLNLLGTIAAIAPLLGLLGTVVGMIEVFNQVVLVGTGDGAALAGGIAKALITTAAGLGVAIPALVLHRHFTRQIEDYVLRFEREATRLLKLLDGGELAFLRGESALNGVGAEPSGVTNVTAA